MTEQERAMATSPYLSLRQAVRPAILAHWLLAGDQERAGKLAAECEDLLVLTRELLKAAGRARILAEPAPSAQIPDSQESGGDRHAQFLDAYADAGLLWAKVVGCSVALAQALIDRGEWDDVRGWLTSWPDPGNKAPPRTCGYSSGRRSSKRIVNSCGASAIPCRRPRSGKPSMRCGRFCAMFPRSSPTGTGRSIAFWRRSPRPYTPS